MKLESCFSRFVSPAMVLAGVLSLSGAVSAQKAVPDAQIEAGVLKALASAPELTTLGINTTTVYGTVTLSGSVQTEAQRTKAEQLAANAPNVKKVVDELTLSNEAPPAQAQQGPGDGRVLLSDGTYGQADPQMPQQGTPSQQQTSQQQDGANEVPPANGPDTDPYGRPLNQQNARQQNYPQQNAQLPPQTTPQSGYPNQQQSQYPNPAAGQYPQGEYPQNAGQFPPPARRPYNGPYGPPPQQGYNQQAPGYGQIGGQTVTIPVGTTLQVRVNQHLSSRDIQAGMPFQAMVVNDVVSNGQIAIPRGTTVQGTVIDATRSGTLKGRGELGLELNQIVLGGQTFPVASDVFTAHGGDKSLQTVNTTVGLGALGAIFGAVAGGGAGAAIGAGVGAGVGLGASAASGRGDVFIPSEAVLTFHVVQPTSVVTVSQAELQRLGYGVPAGGPRMVRRYPPPGAYYPAPVYYYPRGYYRGPY